MRVRFTTTGRARPGFKYEVDLLMSGPDANGLDCAYGAFSRQRDSTVGAPGQTYTVWLVAPSWMGGYFCHGRAELSVDSVSVQHRSSKTSRTVRTISFRMLRAP